MIKKPKWLYIYNLSLIACVGYPISQKLELLIRMEDIIYIFRTVLLGFVILDVLKNKNTMDGLCICLLFYF